MSLKHARTYLELRSGIVVERAIVVQDVDKLEIMPDTDFVIVGVVRGSDLDSTSTKRHVDDDVVRYDGDLAIDEGVLDELAV